MSRFPMCCTLLLVLLVSMIMASQAGSLSMAPLSSHHFDVQIVSDPDVGAIPVCSGKKGTYCLPFWSNLTTPEASLNTYGVMACTPSMYCAQDQLPIYCPQSYYCPTPVDQIICPSGHFCPMASTQPTACPAASICPQGSARYLPLADLIYLVLLLFILYAVPSLYTWRQRQSSKSVATPVDAASSPALLSPRGSVAAAPSTTAASSLSLDFNNLHATLSTKKVILNDISGAFCTGRFTAIMGGSGAGKTSLLNALLGTLNIDTGVVHAFVDGRPFNANSSKAVLSSGSMTAQQSGLVSIAGQADIMLPTMTVFDVLLHAACIRLPSSISHAEKVERVEQVLTWLGLSELRNTRIGDERWRGISGGQKKRVSIGIELVGQPAFLFLDEPTTGLDSNTSIQLIRKLKQLSTTTVVAVLHQPRTEIFDMIDDLLLLAPGGYTVYFGPARFALEYFATMGFNCPDTTNPADFFLDVVSQKTKLPYPNNSPVSSLLKAHPDPGASSANRATALVEKNAASSIEIAPLHSMDERKEPSVAPTIGGLVDVPLSSATSKPAALLNHFPALSVALKDGSIKLPTHPNDIRSYLLACWKVVEATTLSQYQNIIAESNQQIKKQQEFAPPSATSLIKLSMNGSPTLSSVYPSAFFQFFYFLRRSWLQLWRDRTVVRFELLMHIICGALIGLAFSEDFYFVPPMPRQYVSFCPLPMQKYCHDMPIREKYQLMCTFVTMALGLVAAIIGNRNFGHELLNAKREIAAGASPTAYFLAKVFADLPLILVYSLTFICAMAVVCAPPATMSAMFLCIWWLEWATFALGYLCSLVFENQDNAALASVVAALLGGLATDNSSPDKQFCWARWFSEAYYISLMRLDQTSPQVEQVIREYATASANFNMDGFANALGGLVIYVAVMLLLAYIKLRYNHRVVKL